MNKTEMNYALNFNTSFHQIFIRDKYSEEDTGNSNFWTDEATFTRMAIAKNIIGVGLECYGNFKGELRLLNSDNSKLNLSKFDHVVEGGIFINSGILQITDCPNNRIELEIAINPRIYRVRVYSQNLKTVCDDNGDDFYIIEIWPGISLERLIIKQYYLN